MTVAKTVRIRRLTDPPDDTAYWLSRPPQERLAALEEIRQAYHRWRYHAEPRLQRVCTIVKR